MNYFLSFVAAQRFNSEGKYDMAFEESEKFFELIDLYKNSGRRIGSNELEAINVKIEVITEIMKLAKIELDNKMKTKTKAIPVSSLRRKLVR